MTPLHRTVLSWTPLVFAFPRRYLDPDAVRDLDIEAFAAAFTWEQDAWNGLKDFAAPVRETVATGRGDCEDFALVAASWAVANERPGVGLGLCWSGPIPAHAIAYDADRVYSSGRIHETSVAGYRAASRYDRVLRRRLTD